MDELLGDDQTVVADEGVTCGSDSFLPVRRQWDVRCAGVFPR